MADGAALRPLPPSTSDPFADWDPDLTGDPSRPAPLDAPLAFTARQPAHTQQGAPAPRRDPAPAAATAPAPVHEPAPPAAAAPRVPPPSLVDAFAALLAAEQRIGLSPSAAIAPLPASAASDAPAMTEELIETVTARVVARLSEESRHTILDAAERLVREEIDRIKQASGN